MIKAKGRTLMCHINSGFIHISPPRCSVLSFLSWSVSKRSCSEGSQHPERNPCLTSHQLCASSCLSSLDWHYFWSPSMLFYCYFLCSFYITNNVKNADLMAYKKKKAALGLWFSLKAECPMSCDGRTPVLHRDPAGDPPWGVYKRSIL